MNAASIIVAQNDSGKGEPSQEDLKTARPPGRGGQDPRDHHTRLRCRQSPRLGRSQLLLSDDRMYKAIRNGVARKDRLPVLA